MTKGKKSYAVSFVVNVHHSTSTKRQLKKLAKVFVDGLQASFGAGLASGITGDCSFNIDNLVDPPFAPPGRTMTWQQLEESIGDQMDESERPTDPYDPIAIRMSDGNPLTGARLVRSARGSGWELWLSDAPY